MWGLREKGTEAIACSREGPGKQRNGQCEEDPTERTLKTLSSSPQIVG